MEHLEEEVKTYTQLGLASTNVDFASLGEMNRTWFDNYLKSLSL